ncbi:MAG: MogA/MoaB family molybdenum cofactor biosynthesis protein [Deltaproteobacteria bacterium]|nr:MogA/MoaB family molybdenum cofactor biosynthesis protein [Deltaproteobacteria bacterium]
MRYAVLTLSDKASRGEREDTAGPAVRAMMDDKAGTCVHASILADDRDQVEEELRRLCDKEHAQIVLTVGGTGFTKRDVAPEAALAVAERQAPGLAEAMRARSLQVTPHAMLSRAVAVIRGESLIVNLPGSRKGAVECLEVILPALPHACALLDGTAGDKDHAPK